MQLLFFAEFAEFLKFQTLFGAGIVFAAALFSLII
jgi:hypothetical protein